MVTTVTTDSTADRAGAPSRSRASQGVLRQLVPALAALRLAKKLDRRDAERRAGLLDRVRGEFSEMPCMRLTRDEAARLFGLRPDVCARVLDNLAGAGDIREGPDGRFSRAEPAV